MLRASLSHIWQPGAIGPLQLPHRIVMGSMHLGLEAIGDDGAALAAFYRERAAAGAALIVTGGAAVSRVGAGGPSYGLIDEDAGARALERAAAAVHEAGGRILMQLFHAGRYAREHAFGLQPVAPSAVYSSYSRCEPRALSGEEVLETIADFARGAARARELGFDGIELMGSEGYLLNQFTAPATNLREDQWGGDAERRLQFPLAVAAAVRDMAGPGQVVVYRISGADLVPGGTEHQQVLELARRLASGPVDALNVGIGWHEAKVPTVQGTVPPGAWAPWVRAIRAAVTVPVIASNRINTLAQADALIAAGDADFGSLARPFLADPEIVAKAREHGRRAVNVCISCNQACIDRSIFDRRVSCVVNPRAGHELEARRAPALRAGARLAVVGGGPAGMAAALALARAGCSVELLEAGTRIGGQFRMACRIPGKQEFAGTIAYFEQELSRLGVTVSLGARVSDAVGLADFDGVAVATGVTPRAVELPGAELPHVLSYARLLLDPEVEGEGDVGRRVAIIGGGGIGVDVAHLLSHRPPRDARVEFYAAHGLQPPGGGDPPDASDGELRAADMEQRRVVLMRRGQRIGAGIGPSTRWVALQALERAGVELLTGVTYERIEPDAVVIRDGDGAERRVPADTVVVAAGQEPADELAAALRERGQPHVVIGGAAGAAELDAERAFREGAEAPYRLAVALAG